MRPAVVITSSICTSCWYGLLLIVPHVLIVPRLLAALRLIIVPRLFAVLIAHCATSVYCCVFFFFFCATFGFAARAACLPSFFRQSIMLIYAKVWKTVLFRKP